MRLLLLLSGLASAGFPLAPFPECGTPERPDLCPNDLGTTWNLISYLPPSWSSVRLEEVDLGPGLHADRAWSRTMGDPSVIIAVLDSGIKWDEPDLVNKAWLNLGELPLPQNALGEAFPTYDANEDGVVTVQDWSEDPRVAIDAGQDRADGFLDPSDLIHSLSNGIDDDGNGFIDDISGWDFFWNDNDPYDDTRYGHGTGEAMDSTAEGNNGSGDIGTCPNCRSLHLRVGDSFVADGANYGAAVLYAVSMDAKVIQEALGNIDHPDFAERAVAAAWAEGVLVVASAADETSWHPNHPGANDYTLFVHAVRYSADDREDAETFLAYSNCTNHGIRLDLSAPSTSCSSGAVGVTSGVAGLVYGAAAERGLELSSAEAWALLALTADDIDQSWATDIFSADHPIWYPTTAGWDPFSGYGRVNAHAAVSAVLDDQIPPEAEIWDPRWFASLDPTDGSAIVIRGRVDAPRGEVQEWTLEVGITDNPTSWTPVASGSGPQEGVLGELDIGDLALDARKITREWTTDDDSVSREQAVHENVASLRLRVTDTEGRTGEARKSFFVSEDPQRMVGFPLFLGGSLEASPLLVDLDGDGILDLVQASSDGIVFAMHGDGRTVPGWPVEVELLEEFDPEHPDNHLDNPMFAAMGEARAGIVSSPAAADLDGDGRPEVVAATLRGKVWAWDGAGNVVAGFPVSMEPVDRERLSTEYRVDEGFFSSPALGDLDGDGDREIVVGGMDGQVYAWHHDGSPVEGWPVLLQHPESEGRQERIISSPALADLDGDGGMDVVIGSNEPIRTTWSPLWAIRGQGESHPDGPILPGWPVLLFGTGVDVLPLVGEGTPNSPLVLDLDADGDLEVAAHTAGGPLTVFEHDGTQRYQAVATLDSYGEGSNVWDAVGLPFINSPSAGDINGDGQLDLVSGSIGGGFATAALQDFRRTRFDFPLIVWDGATGRPLPSFPRQVEDLQFFMNPAVADIDGDGQMEVLHGSGGFLLHAFSPDGTEPDGWPKHTGQWLLGSPTVGDIDGDGLLEVAISTRQGWLWAWDTTSPAGAPVSWAGFGHDPAHTRNMETELEGYNTGLPSDTGSPTAEDSGSAADTTKGSPEGCGCGGGAPAGLAGVFTSLLALYRRRRGESR